MCPHGRTHCHHLSNNIEPSVYGGDAPYVKLLWPLVIFGHAHLGNRTDSQVLRTKYCIVGIPSKIQPSSYVYFLYISFDWWMCAFVVLRLVFPCQGKRLAWRTSPKWPILCRVGRKTTAQSINYECLHQIIEFDNLLHADILIVLIGWTHHASKAASVKCIFHFLLTKLVK